MPALIDKPCKGCGTMMYQVHIAREYCHKCAYRRNINAAKKSRKLAPRFDKPCEDCGKMMYQVTAGRRFCDECLQRREKQRDSLPYHAKYHRGERMNKPCAYCGKMMYNVSGQKLYCDACLKLREKLRKRGEFPPVAEVLKQTAKPGHAPKTHDLNSDALNAWKEDLSYGYYILKHGLF